MPWRWPSSTEEIPSCSRPAKSWRNTSPSRTRRGCCGSGSSRTSAPPTCPSLSKCWDRSSTSGSSPRRGGTSRASPPPDCSSAGQADPRVGSPSPASGAGGCPLRKAPRQPRRPAGRPEVPLSWPTARRLQASRTAIPRRACAAPPPHADDAQPRATATAPPVPAAPLAQARPARPSPRSPDGASPPAGLSQCPPRRNGFWARRIHRRRTSAHREGSSRCSAPNCRH